MVKGLNQNGHTQRQKTLYQTNGHKAIVQIKRKGKLLS